MSFEDRDFNRDRHNPHALGEKKSLREIGRYPEAPLPSSYTWLDEIFAWYPWAKPLLMVLIILVVGLLFAALHEILSKKAYFTPAPMAISNYSRLEMDGKKIILRRGRNGHYFIPVSINYQERLFIVDTGASTTAVSTEYARFAGVQVVGNCNSRTANGTVNGWAGVAQINIGPYKLAGEHVCILPNLSEPLLGMSVLRQFEVLFSDEKMVLTPKR